MRLFFDFVTKAFSLIRNSFGFIFGRSFDDTERPGEKYIQHPLQGQGGIAQELRHRPGKGGTKEAVEHS